MRDFWLHGWLTDDKAQALAVAKSLSVQNVIVGQDETEIALARQHGLQPWLCLGAFSAQPQEENLLCRSLSGQPKVWFGSGCPNHPDIRERLLEKARKASKYPVAGILLDGIRFASPYEGQETFLTCTCGYCRAAAERLGISFPLITAALERLPEQLAQIPLATLESHASGLLAPVDGLAALPLGLLAWIKFRAAVITEIVAEVRDTIQSEAPNLRLGAYLFTPSLASFVGQDYLSLRNIVDVILPMIYRGDAGPSCLPSEINGLCSLFNQTGRAVTQTVLAYLGLSGTEIPEYPPTKRLGHAAIAREMRRASALISGHCDLAPILWLDDPEVSVATAAAAYGSPTGISYFATGNAKTDRLRAAIR